LRGVRLSRDCDRTVQARQARVLHPASIFVTHCVRAARLGVGFSIVTRRRVQRSLARVHLEDGAAGALCLSLSLSLSVTFCPSQGRRRDRIILRRFSCFPVLDVLYARPLVSRVACRTRACNSETNRHLPGFYLPLSLNMCTPRNNRRRKVSRPGNTRKSKNITQFVNLQIGKFSKLSDKKLLV